MKKLFVALLVGSLLVGSSVSATTYNSLCSGGINCPLTTVTDLGIWTIPTIYATDVQSAHVGSSNGDFSQLQVGAGGLTVYGSETITGNLDLTGWLNAGATHVASLVVDGSISFSANGYAQISSLPTGLQITANQILFMNSDGKGLCTVNKSLDGSKTIWSWFDNSGSPQSTTSLGSVPTQCLTTH